MPTRLQVAIHLHPTFLWNPGRTGPHKQKHLKDTHQSDSSYVRYRSYAFSHFLFSPNSFSYRGSYFKYRGEGSQIFWIRFGGGCRAGCRPRCRLIFTWWCVWVSVRRFFGFVLGQQVSSCNDAKLLFCVCRCFAS